MAETLGNGLQERYGFARDLGRQVGLGALLKPTKHPKILFAPS